MNIKYKKKVKKPQELHNFSYGFIAQVTGDHRIIHFDKITCPFNYVNVYQIIYTLISLYLHKSINGIHLFRSNYINIPLGIPLFRLKYP